MLIWDMYPVAVLKSVQFSSKIAIIGNNLSHLDSCYSHCEGNVFIGVTILLSA